MVDGAGEPAKAVYFLSGVTPETFMNQIVDRFLGL